MSPAEPGARGRARVQEVLARALGALDGVLLETPVGQESTDDAQVLRPDDGPRLLVPVEVSKRGGRRSLALLRVLPLAMPGATSPPKGGAAPGRWRQEWEDLTSPARGDAGVPNPHPAGVALPRHAPVLPPLFYCRAKNVWIAAVCPGCGGPGDGASTENRCASCGSPASAASGGSPAALPPLRALWDRVNGKGTGDELDPACVSCDRRTACFPSSGPPEGPGAAVDALQAISSSPWGGVLLEPFHLPFDAWCRLASGTSWMEVRPSLSGVPASILEEADARLREERPFLQPEASREPFGLESLLLRLETLRQLLEGLRALAVEAGHPHLGLAPGTVWVRLEEPGSLRTALWGARLSFVDTSPGWAPERGGGKAPSLRPPFLVPPGCERGDESFEGLCIARASGGVVADKGAIGIDFLPNAPLARPPAKGDAVLLGVPGPKSGDVERVLSARVEIGFPEVCRILVSDPALTSDEIRGLLTGAAVKLWLRRDHSLVDDLFAAGTLFLSSLLRAPGDAAEAARFRDALAPRLLGAGGADGGATEALRAVTSSGLFPVHDMSSPAGSSPASRGVTAMLDRALTARAVALGMRLCAAVPGGFPCQAHEPVGPAERERAYLGLLSDLTAFSRDVRERLLATAATGDTALAALGAFAVERLKALAEGRPVHGSGVAPVSGKEPR